MRCHTSDRVVPHGPASGAVMRTEAVVPRLAGDGTHRTKKALHPFGWSARGLQAQVGASRLGLLPVAGVLPGVGNWGNRTVGVVAVGKEQIEI